MGAPFLTLSASGFRSWCSHSSPALRRGLGAASKLGTTAPFLHPHSLAEGGGRTTHTTACPALLLWPQRPRTIYLPADGKSSPCPPCTAPYEPAGNAGSPGEGAGIMAGSGAADFSGGLAWTAASLCIATTWAPWLSQGHAQVSRSLANLKTKPCALGSSSQQLHRQAGAEGTGSAGRRLRSRSCPELLTTRTGTRNTAQSLS